MKVCDVIAAEFFGIGVFKDIHRQIFDEYGPFQKVYTWGAPRLGGWTGSITNSFTCQTYRCNRSAHVPSEYLSIEPKPPLTGDWMWISAHPLPMLPDSEVDPAYLNSAPLNWAPTGR